MRETWLAPWLQFVRRPQDEFQPELNRQSTGFAENRDIIVKDGMRGGSAGNGTSTDSDDISSARLDIVRLRFHSESALALRIGQ